MKKLIFAAAVVLAAVVVEAASFKWKTGMDDGVSFPGGTTWVTGSAYLFAASTDGTGATLAQSALVSAFAAGTLDLSKQAYLDIGTADEGDIAKNTDAFDYGAKDNTTQFYFAMLTKDGENNDLLYVSTLAEGLGQGEGKVSTLSFSEATASALAAKDATGGYSGAGWYETVPEPFSGTLALLGMGVVALRRKMKKQKKA